MFGWLLPKEYDFFNRLEEHAAVTVQAAHEFYDMVDEVKVPLNTSLSIKTLEHQADNITHTFVETMHKNCKPRN